MLIFDDSHKSTYFTSDSQNLTVPPVHHECFLRSSRSIDLIHSFLVYSSHHSRILPLECQAATVVPITAVVIWFWQLIGFGLNTRHDKQVMTYLTSFLLLAFVAASLNNSYTR